MRFLLLIGIALCGLTNSTAQTLANENQLVVELETTEVPELHDWGMDARELLLQWHPRLSNLLSSKGFVPAQSIKLVLKKSDQGVAATTGTTITVSSHWIQKHPEDIGLIVHEQVHVIQAYPSGNPWWITEGIADYIRWAIYEGKPQSWFERPQQKQGYKKGYRVMGGFLLWLETERAPGIVRKLNTAMRKQTYSDALFEVETGQTLEELWDRYTTESE